MELTFRTSPVDYPRISLGAKSEERPRCRYGTVARARARSIVKTNDSGDMPVQARRISSRSASFAHLTARARPGRASGPAGRLAIAGSVTARPGRPARGVLIAHATQHPGGNGWLWPEHHVLVSRWDAGRSSQAS